MSDGLVGWALGFSAGMGLASAAWMVACVWMQHRWQRLVDEIISKACPRSDA